MCEGGSRIADLESGRVRDVHASTVNPKYKLADHCGDDLPVLEQTDDVDASFDNNNYATDVSYVLML